MINTKGLVVVKASLKIQWEKEVSKFSNYTGKAIQTYANITKNQKNKIKKLNDKLSKLSIKDKQRKDIVKAIKEVELEAEEVFLKQFDEGDILILNYETLLDQKVIDKVLSMKLDFVFCDEVQYIKSRKADRSKATYKLCDAKIKVGATATPITKDPQDVYGLFKFINKDLLGKVGEFERRHISYAGFGKINGFKNMDELKDKISDNIFLKTKDEISSQLPKLSVLKQYIDLTREHVDKHEAILAELDALNNQDFEIRRNCKSEQEAMMNEDLNKISAKVMALQTFAQELADSNELLLSSESEMSKEYAISTKENPKLDYCLELIEQIVTSDEKVVIFSKFERMQSILTEAINKLSKKIKTAIDIAYINGSLSSEKRYEEAYVKFRDMDNYKVLLCSDAGAEGLNINRCKYLIEYEPSTSYAIETQRHGRLERADSVHNNVIVYQLIANNSWDEIQEKIIEKKKNFDFDIIKSIKR